MRTLFSLLVAMSLAQTAYAEVVTVCDTGPLDQAEIAEAAGFGRTYAEGAVTVFPVFADANLNNGVILGILHPVRGDLAGSGLFEVCSLIYSSRDEVSYFNWVDVRAATASYDPAAGLRIDVPVRYYVGEGRMMDGSVTVFVNQAAGSLIAEEVLPDE